LTPEVSNMVTIHTPWPEIANLVDVAIDELHHKDAILFQIQVHERSLAHRLATYSESRFQRWISDLGYNRIGDEGTIKRLMGLLGVAESQVSRHHQPSSRQQFARRHLACYRNRDDVAQRG
jgi:hypothetical protein